MKLLDVEQYKLPMFTVDTLSTVKGTTVQDVKMIDAPRLWKTLENKGENTTIAVIDTGVDVNHKNLNGKVLKSMNFASDLKVCLETVGLKETSKIDYFIRVLQFCNQNRGRYDSYFKSYYTVIVALANFFDNKFPTYDTLYSSGQTSANNVINEMDTMLRIKLYNYASSGVIDTDKVYSLYLTSFEYNGKLFYYEEMSNGNYCYENHGTHVASICAGNTENDYTGIAPNALIVDLCVQSTAISSGLFFIQDALRWISTFGKDNRINIVNMSLGGSKPWGETQQIIENIISQNIVVVAATGNAQHSESSVDSQYVGYPAGYPDVIAIGSLGRLTEGNEIDYSVSSYYSEIGENIDYTSPGRNIVAALSNSVDGTVVLSGTSMACPYAAGIIALLVNYIFANIALETDFVKKLNYLLSNMTKQVYFQDDVKGTRVLCENFDKHVGYGCIDVNFSKLQRDNVSLITNTISKMPNDWKVEKTRSH